MATALEKKNLEAHVDLCQQRYENLESRLTAVEKKLHHVHLDIQQGNKSMIKVIIGATGTIVATGSAASKTIAGTVYTGTSKIGGSGSEDTLNTAYGAVTNYTGTPTTILKKFTTTYLYTSNFIEIKASVAGSVITFAVTLDDNDSTIGTDQVDGTLTMTTVIRPPSTANLSDSWGTVSQNAASWSLT